MRALDLRRYPRRALVMAASAAAAFAVDFVSKEVAVAAPADPLVFNREPSPVGWVGEPSIFVAIALSFVACLLPTRLVAAATGVALGGAIGNVVSRTRWEHRGGTPDFIRFGDGSIGNVADIFIALGALGMAVSAVVWAVASAARDARRAR